MNNTGKSKSFATLTDPVALGAPATDRGSQWVLRQPELMDSLHELKVKYLAVFASRELVMETSSSN
jgi:hypothetical protein